MKEESANHQMRAHAKLLYTRHDRCIKDIALEVETDEVTVRSWVKDGAWDGVKRSILTSKTAQIERYYNTIEHLDRKMKNDDDEISVKNTDIIAKYTACIKNLKEETTVTEIIDVAEQFMLWLRRKDIVLSKKVSVQLDAFIKHRLSSRAS